MIDCGGGVDMIDWWSLCHVEPESKIRGSARIRFLGFSVSRFLDLCCSMSQFTFFDFSFSPSLFLNLRSCLF